MMHPWRLEGKHAIVFGASKGIGRATAIEMASLGASLTVVARSREALEGLVDVLESGSGAEHRLLSLDINQHRELREALEDITKKAPVHIWVNNTGGPPSGLLNQAEPKALEEAFHQHILSAQVISQVLIPSMQEASYGRIINIISTSVKEPIPGLGVSNTIRGAMGNWAKTLASELASDGITVNNVLPGFTTTGRLKSIIRKKAEKANMDELAMAELMKSFVPMQRFADPAELARAICFLALPAASYITGINLPVDGGRTKSL